MEVVDIIFGKLKNTIYSNDFYFVFSLVVHGGKKCSAIYDGNSPPKALKSVEYQLHGKWVKSKKYGKQFHIYSFKRSEVLNQSQLNYIDFKNKIKK